MKPLSAVALAVAGIVAQPTQALAPAPGHHSPARPFLLAVGPSPLEAARTGAETEDSSSGSLLQSLLSPDSTRSRGLETTSSLLDPNQLRQKTASDSQSTLQHGSAGYEATLGFNTTATPTVAPYAHRSPQDLREAYARTDHPGLRVLLGRVLELQAAGQTPEAIIQQLADRRGFLRDAQLPETLGVDPGLFLAGEGLSVSLTSRPDLQKVDLEAIGQKALKLEANPDQTLDFFLLAAAARGGLHGLDSMISATPDGASHVVSFAYSLANSPYLLLGFENLYHAADQSDESKLFAVNLGASQVAALTATPEPATWLTLGACTAVGLWWRRRGASPGQEPVNP